MEQNTWAIAHQNDEKSALLDNKALTIAHQNDEKSALLHKKSMNYSPSKQRKKRDFAQKSMNYSPTKQQQKRGFIQLYIFDHFAWTIAFAFSHFCRIFVLFCMDYRLCFLSILVHL